MEYAVLGPLEVRYEGRPLDLGGRRHRALLGWLLLHPNEVVTVEGLIEAMWGEAPPASARQALQNHVCGLRKLLRAGEATDGWFAAALRTRDAGYVLHVDPGR